MGIPRMTHLENHTINEFILLGLLQYAPNHLCLFALVTMIFLFMLTGNGLLTIVILVDTCLHTPIYFFLWSCLSLMSSLLLPLYPRWWWTTFCSKGSSLFLVVARRYSCGWLWEELSVSSWVSCPMIEMLLSASLYTSHSTWTGPSVGRWHFVHGPVVLSIPWSILSTPWDSPLVDPEKPIISAVNFLDSSISPVGTPWPMRLGFSLVPPFFSVFHFQSSLLPTQSFWLLSSNILHWEPQESILYLHISPYSGQFTL